MAPAHPEARSGYSLSVGHRPSSIDGHAGVSRRGAVDASRHPQLPLVLGRTADRRPSSSVQTEHPRSHQPGYLQPGNEPSRVLPSGSRIMGATDFSGGARWDEARTWSLSSRRQDAGAPMHGTSHDGVRPTEPGFARTHDQDGRQRDGEDGYHPPPTPPGAPRIPRLPTPDFDDMDYDKDEGVSYQFCACCNVDGTCSRGNP
ncbi:hypothetical protein GGS23DRAFT_562425 [Durotheca rogersii]|uniref:uncharacterized protein n=1 Tax=Durotheca rogersii TaxID=419775 RepID=UPI0022205D81|nr:uncharacterized protein GGS23DRAFT_562425 [Durotheca rogersii]KAI5864940.1 hypothetical protein GGS23DRAFT_562425 [Durotheca rogersii]